LTNKKGTSPKIAKSAARTKGKAVVAKVAANKPQGKPPAPVLKAKTSRPIAPARFKVVEEEPVVIPTAAAVPTNGRPRKNLAGITPRELEVFRDRILAKRREIVGDMSSMEREALRSGSGSNLSNLPLHMADMGTDNYEQEFTLGLMEKDRKLLRDLNDGLAKIQNGTYGICEGTGKPISKARLEAQPWARYSIEYARKLERRLG
jgi:RNA polymerase-binding protein DksA